MDAIRIEGLTRRYGRVEALGGVDLAVEAVAPQVSRTLSKVE